MAKKVATTPVVTEETPKYPAEWLKRVGGFATAVGITIEVATEKLTEAVGEPSEEALAILADQIAAPDADLKAIFADLKIPAFVLNKNIGKLRGEKPITETKTEATSIGHTLNILPTLPDDESFIKMLKTDGELKVGVAEVLSAVKAGIAKTTGLYDFPEKMLAKMEHFAETQEQPCGKDFFEIQKLLNTKNYADVLTVVGVPGTFVSTARKNSFMARVDELLWPALKSFQDQVVAWEQQWMSIAGNPALIGIMLASSGRGSAALPAGMTQSPDTSGVRSAGEEVINTINKVFAGPGIPVARAMAYDAARVTEIISKPEILAQAGYTSKDMMLKELGIAVGSDLVRIERSITQYVLSIMSLPEVGMENEALYLSTLANLGKTIDFGKLSGRGIGGRKLTA